jgi:glycosyltransferase involved in cell wall biosynthesis
MRFLIDVTDLKVPLPCKYTRVLRALSASIGARAGLAVEISDIGNQIMLTEVAWKPTHDSASVWWQSIPWSHALRLIYSGRTPKLLSFYFYQKISGRILPPELKDELAWNLAYSFENFSFKWRNRLARLLQIDVNAKRLALFYYWLAERGITLDTYLRTHVQYDSARAVLPDKDDVLVLAGASWRYDICALEKAKKIHGFRLVCLIYDLLPIDYPSFATVRQRRQFKKFLCDIGRVADLIVTPNAATASRLNSFFAENDVPLVAGGSISLAGASLARGPGEISPRLRELGLDRRTFMLCVSPLRERKHVLWLYALCIKLREKLPEFPLLVFAGRAADAGILGIFSDDPAWGEAGVFLEEPCDTELSWLYGNAQLCLQPSFEGGLGMAVTEAIKFERHCIAADAPSLVEASGGLAEHLPCDATLWAHAILRGLEKEDRAKSDRDDFGSDQSKIMEIDSNNLERDDGGKRVSTFPRPALSCRSVLSSPDILLQINALLEEGRSAFSIEMGQPDLPLSRSGTDAIVAVARSPQMYI